MWLLFTLLGALLQVLASAEGNRFRIIGGRSATSKEFPYQATLEKHYRPYCGGSIIHEYFILTAAHCTSRYSSMKPVPLYTLRVRVGNDEALTGGDVHGIGEIFVHEKYDRSNEIDQYDIALLLLSTPLQLSDRVAIVSLPKHEPREGLLGWVTGFGKQEVVITSRSFADYLTAVEVAVVSLNKCRLILQNVADDMICAGFGVSQRDACVGDSGGPFVVNGEVVGIVAWGIGCGQGIPGVYTNVAMYRDWIMSKIQKALSDGRR